MGNKRSTLEKVLMIFPIFFGGGFLFFILGAISEELPRFYRWADSLPLWGVWIIYIVFGLIAFGIYEKWLNTEAKKD